MQFTKMQALGNDYIYLDCTKEEPDRLPELAVRLSERHFGVGGDGLICLCPSRRADFRMRMFNADGSEGEMCGNGLRCLAKFAYDRGLWRGEALSIETNTGVKEIHLQIEGGTVTGATVDIGPPVFAETCTIFAFDKEYYFTCVSMGNPHAVALCAAPEEVDLVRIGPLVERHPYFPGRTNVEFAAVETPGRIRVRVWERGSGETLACGTGACAAVAALADRGLCRPEAEVVLPGGSLRVRWDRAGGSLYLTGPAATVFEGVGPDD